LLNPGVGLITAVVASTVRNPSSENLVLDIGSCITYDLINVGIFLKSESDRHFNQIGNDK